MKKLRLMIALLFLGVISMTYGQADEKAPVVSADGETIEVYYFHNTRRCATCQAVEDESIKALEEYYAEQLENGSLIFLSINLEEETNEKLAESLEVATQSLLVVKGDEIVDLTNDGFKYARSNPEKLHESLKDTIDGML